MASSVDAEDRKYPNLNLELPLKNICNEGYGSFSVILHAWVSPAADSS